MSKKQINSKMAPIVMVHFLDLCYCGEGVPDGARKFLAIGLVIKEDSHGYFLGHWVDAETPKSSADEGQIASYILKSTVTHIEVLSHLPVTGEK